MDVDAYVESIRVELPLEDGFDLIQSKEAVHLLMEGPIGNMISGDHQGMPRTQRELIKNRRDCCGINNHRPECLNYLNFGQP